MHQGGVVAIVPGVWAGSQELGNVPVAGDSGLALQNNHCVDHGSLTVEFAGTDLVQQGGWGGEKAIGECVVGEMVVEGLAGDQALEVGLPEGISGWVHTSSEISAQIGVDGVPKR